MNCGSRSDKQQKIFRILLEVAPRAPVYCILLVVMHLLPEYHTQAISMTVGPDGKILGFCFV